MINNEKIILENFPFITDIEKIGNILKNLVFNLVGIEIFWLYFSDYPIYDQLWGPFIDEVSVIDLLFNHGEKSKEVI